MSVRFGRWELRSMKGGNWALWRLTAPTDGSEPRWQPCERYYQWNTVGNALTYAANEELMGGNEHEALTFQEYADDLKAVLDGFLADVRESVREGGPCIRTR